MRRCRASEKLEEKGKSPKHGVDADGLRESLRTEGGAKNEVTYVQNVWSHRLN